MNYMHYSFLDKKDKPINKLDEIDCHKCLHCYDNKEALHFYICDELGGCIDCYPNQCKGTRFKQK